MWLLSVEYHFGYMPDAWVLYGYDCLPPTRFVLHNTMCYQSVRVFFMRSRRIDHKHEKMSDHRDAGLKQIWPCMADENLPTNLLVFCYPKSSWIDFLMCYQLVENKGFIIKTTNRQQVMQIFGNVSMAKNKLGNCSAPKRPKPTERCKSLTKKDTGYKVLYGRAQTFAPCYSYR